MWVNAHDFQGNILHLNLALARSIARTAVDTSDGITAQTVIVFDETPSTPCMRRRRNS